MEFSRRDFLLLSLGGVGLLAAGCAGPGELANDRPGPLWPGTIGRPIGPSAGVPIGPGELPNPGPVTPSVSGGTGPLKAIPRSAWTRQGPMLARILPMGGVERITVHHEGSEVVTFDDVPNTIKRLESVRNYHAVDRGWGDIGYHFVIDRAGRLWQGRDLAYQGAHVRDHNPHNIGVMVMGNFDLQRPTDAQLTTLRATLITLQKTYRVPIQRVHTHQELMPTECPGVALQKNMVALRRAGLA